MHSLAVNFIYLHIQIVYFSNKYMKIRFIKFVGLFLISLAPFIFSSCEPDDTSASNDWVGNWRITEDIVYPQKKSTAGTIRIDPENENKIIISGELFGLNSSFKITGTVSSTSSTSVTFSREGSFKITGSAKLTNKEITFNFTYTSENGVTETYTRKAVKI
ncbi:MAG: hypothetical protein H6Q15_1357 [Bacteroidetes bacterium]|nr:hypothetical protein [Bacteroidota bacterium]